jgi:hypothetical protein
MVKQHRTGFNVVVAHQEHPGVKLTAYIEHFIRTRSMIKFSLILSSDGIVVPLPRVTSPNLTDAEIPRDLEEIFTSRLPEEVYFYLSRGLLGPQALIWLTSGQIIENPPLDNGDSQEYKRFVREVLTEGSPPPRTTALALVSHVLHEFWQRKKVTAWFWFDPPHVQYGRALSHASPTSVELVKRIGSWKVPAHIIEEELRRQAVTTLKFDSSSPSF